LWFKEQNISHHCQQSSSAVDKLQPVDSKLKMSCTKDNILTLGLIGGSLALFPFLDDPTKMFLELLLIGGQLGTQVWFNFIATPTMRANMAKKALGDIQSLLFPKFGLVGSGTSLMALVANWTRSKSSFWAQM